MKIKVPTLKELNCANHHEVGLRCQFQDWITTHMGYLSIPERDRLWARFRAGRRISVDGKRRIVRLLK